MKKLLGFSIFLVFVLIASLTAEAKVTLPAIFFRQHGIAAKHTGECGGKLRPEKK